MMLGMLLFWVLVIVGAIWLVRALLGNRQTSLNSEALTPRQIVNQRYARGEITRTEYEQILRDIAS